jgi:hypothetical protein
MNVETIFSFLFDYGMVPLIIGLVAAVGWFAYDETQKVTNDVSDHK